MNNKELSACPQCVVGRMKLIAVRKNPKDIDDVYEIMCSNCNTTWHLAIKKGEDYIEVWNGIVERWKGRFHCN